MSVVAVGQPVAAVGSTTSSVAFSSFSPVSASSYYIWAGCNSNGSGSPAATITGIAFASGGSITRVAQFQVNAFNQEVSLWEIKPGNGGTGAITITGNAAATTTFGAIMEETGVATGTTVGATANNGQTGTSGELAVTPTSTGGLVHFIGLDSFESLTVTPDGTSSLLSSQNLGGAQHVAIIGNANTVTGVSYTTGFTATGISSGGLAILVVEILPAPAGGLPAQPIVAPNAAVHRAATW